MLGVYDFNGHYDWTFAWLQDRGGEGAVHDYWLHAISHDAQSHARAEFTRGFEGMQDYWGHTLAEEGAGYTSRLANAPATGKPLMRIDMTACPSKGFLLRNDIDFGTDYCDHCIGWIGPALEDAGYVVDHDHDHQAHCWWEIRRDVDQSPPSGPGEVSGVDDVRFLPGWSEDTVDSFRRTSDASDKAQRLSPS